MERRPHGAPASSPACAAPSAPQPASCRPRRPMERRRPRRPTPHRRPLSQSPPTVPPHGAPASSPACAAASAPWPVSCRQRRPHGAPASSPACAAPSAPHSNLVSTAAPRTDGPWAGRPTEHARLRRRPMRTPALQNTRALTYAAPAPWSAGPMERRRPRRPAPHRRRRRSASIRRPSGCLPHSCVADKAEHNAEGRFAAWFSRDGSPLECRVTLSAGCSNRRHAGLRSAARSIWKAVKRSSRRWSCRRRASSQFRAWWSSLPSGRESSFSKKPRIVWRNNASSAA